MAGSVCNIPAFYSEVSGSDLGFDTENFALETFSRIVSRRWSGRYINRDSDFSF